MKFLVRFLSHLKLLCCLWLLFISACFHQDIDNSELDLWQPSLAVPLVNSLFTVENLLHNLGNDGRLGAENDLVIVTYSKRLLSASGRDIIKIPDIQFSVEGDALRIFFSFPEGTEISLLKLEQAIFDFLINTSTTQETEVTIRLPSAEKDGASLNETILIPSGEDAEHTGSLDLSSYTISLDKNEQDLHFVDLILDARDPLTGEKIEIDFEGIIRDILFSYIEGQFANLDLGEYLDTLNIRPFENWVSGELFIINPQIVIHTDNSFGFPLAASFTNFGGTRGDLSQILEGSVINDFWVPAYPQGSPGQSTTDELVIDSFNSNLSDFLSFTPNKIFYSLKLQGAIDIDFDVIGFITDSSRLVVDTDIIMPLECRLDNIILRNMFPLNLSEIKSITQVNFIIESDNGFPHDMALQVYLADDEGIVLDSLFREEANIMKSGVVDFNGRVLTSAKATTQVQLPSEKLNTVYESTQMITELRVNSAVSGTSVVKYTIDNTFDLKIRAMISIKP